MSKTNKTTKESIAAVDEALRSAGSSPSVAVTTSKTPIPDVPEPPRVSTAAGVQVLAHMGGLDVDAQLGMPDPSFEWKPRSEFPPISIATSLEAVAKVDPDQAAVLAKVQALRDAGRYQKFDQVGVPSSADPKIAGIEAFGAPDGIDESLSEVPAGLLEMAASSQGFVLPSTLTVDKQVRKLREVLSKHTGSYEMLRFFKGLVNDLQQVASAIWPGIPFLVPGVLDDTINGPWKHSMLVSKPVGARAGLACILDPELASFSKTIDSEIRPLVVAGLASENVGVLALNIDHPDIIKIFDDLQDAKKTSNAKEAIMQAAFMPVLELLVESKIVWNSTEASHFWNKFQRMAMIKDVQNWSSVRAAEAAYKAAAAPAAPVATKAVVAPTPSAAQAPRGRQVPPSPESAFRKRRRRSDSDSDTDPDEIEAALAAAASSSRRTRSGGAASSSTDVLATVPSGVTHAPNGQPQPSMAEISRRYISVGDLLDGKEAEGDDQGAGDNFAGGAASALPSFAGLLVSTASAASSAPSTLASPAAFSSSSTLVSPTSASAASAILDLGAAEKKKEKGFEFSSIEHAILAHDRMQPQLEVPWGDIHKNFQCSVSSDDISFNKRTLMRFEGTHEGRHLQLLLRIRDMCKKNSPFGIFHTGIAGGARIEAEESAFKGFLQEIEAAKAQGISEAFFHNFAFHVGRSTGRQTIPSKYAALAAADAQGDGAEGDGAEY